jgi:hypothetical protein
VPFLRLSRDRRGYENTFLLHARHPGERPTVLYWYRTAPGVRVGRPPLDEEAIRTLESQHPDIPFDWAEILAVGTAALVEAEAPSPARRRKPSPRPKPPAASGEPPATPIRALAGGPAASRTSAEPAPLSKEDAAVSPPPAHDLLEELVGRDIATRLHARYAELAARISELPVDELTRDAWRTRAEAMNPDNWVTPDEILSGVQRAGGLFDDLKRELPGAH